MFKRVSGWMGGWEKQRQYIPSKSENASLQYYIFVTKYSQFHTEFSRHVPICSESSRIENNLANHRTYQQRDLYLNKHCRYIMLTSENVRICMIFAYIRNFNRQIARYHAANDVFGM